MNLLSMKNFEKVASLESITECLLEDETIKQVSLATWYIQMFAVLWKLTLSVGRDIMLSLRMISPNTKWSIT